MNLSRQAKKFRAMQPKESEAPRPAASKKAKAPVAEPVVEKVEPVKVEPVPAPVVVEAVPPPAPPKPVVVKPKRTRFVREKTEKRERVTLPPLVSSNKFVAKVLTKNVVPVPKEESKLK